MWRAISGCDVLFPAAQAREILLYEYHHSMHNFVVPLPCRVGNTKLKKKLMSIKCSCFNFKFIEQKSNLLVQSPLFKKLNKHTTVSENWIKYQSYNHWEEYFITDGLGSKKILEIKKPNTHRFNQCFIHTDTKKKLCTYVFW